jgi:osmotically-inducible protein OsmY
VTPDDYVVGHVRDALAHEGVTDVHAVVVAGQLVLTGHVATPSRRDEVSEIAGRVAGDLRVVNELAVLNCPPPEAAEELA